MFTDYYVAWWNLENLFDVEDAPLDRRPDKVKRALGDDIKGWTAAKLDRKVDQLASVIAQMNGGAGPDLLGVCEVENRFVLDLLVANLSARLPGRAYDLAHADTKDARGIDVAFLFDTTHLEVPPGETFFHVVMRRNATREIVQVNFRTKVAQRTWAVFGNHCPRAAAASTSPPGIGRSRARRCRTSTSGCSRCTGTRHRCWRWAISTTNRSMSPWSHTR